MPKAPLRIGRLEVRCQAIILAGGLSSRMGRDKSRLRLGGKTLLAHARFAAAEAGLPVKVIRRDSVPRCGPIGGILTAFQQTRAETLVFLSCDMPFVSAALLRRLVAKTPARCQAAFVSDQRVGFPFLIRRGALAHLETMVNQRQLSLQVLAGALNAVRFQLGPRDRFVSFNVNTPEDLRAAQRIYKQLKTRSKA